MSTPNPKPQAGDELRRPLEADLLITRGIVITMNPTRSIYSHGAVAIAGDRIIAVGPAHEIESSYSAQKVIDAGGGVIQPGFVDCHVHLSQHLGRGTIPDIWPNEMEHEHWLPYWQSLTEDEAFFSAMLGCMEMVRNGTTTFCDNGARFSAELNASAAEKVGLRGMVSELCWDRPPHPQVSRGDTSQCLKHLERQLSALPASPGRLVRACVGLAGMGTCSDALLREGKALAEESKVIMDLHQSFGPGDTTHYRIRARGLPAVHHLQRLGVLGENLQLVHMIYTDLGEIPLLAESHTRVVHCPAASTRCAMGVSRVGKFPEMLSAGVNVALGSDSGNYSDYFDIGRQAYLAATIHREARGKMPIISAEQALEMATINGARSLGIDDLVGSLEAGKKADIVLHSYSRPEWRPALNVINELVYSAQSVGVDTVIVDGEIILQHGRFTRIQEDAIYREIDRAARSLFDRMGFTVGGNWPIL